jgi:DNA-binding NtrC family response regulator
MKPLDSIPRYNEEMESPDKSVPERVLIVEDEDGARAGLADVVQSWGYSPATARDGLEALEKLSAVSPVVMITDLKMPRLDGLGLLRKLREDPDPPPAIVLTAHGDEGALEEALKLGAFWFLEKPVRPHMLRVLVDRAVMLRREQRGKRALELDLARAGKLGTLVGDSAAMQEVFRLLNLVGPSKASVLITGESGSGKELVARTIHDLSPRKDRPFVAINCSAIPETLMESEIFGHERGAFTGAQERRAGCFELADGGTLLLDEIGEMPAATQAKLLRVLEDSKVRRLGGKAEIEVDVRVLAATNRDPEEAVREGVLRQDLFFRLNVFQIYIPPLREHLSDLPKLADEVLSVLNQKHGKRITHLSSDVLERFRHYGWPGNVRELRNTLERAMVVAPGDSIEAWHLPPSFGQSRLQAHTSDSGEGVRLELGTTVAEGERRLILKTLEAQNNNKTRAAEVLGISLKTLHNKLKEYREE